MGREDMKRNILLYKWYAVLSEPVFWGPTIILFIQNAGKMSLPEIYLMEAIVLGFMVLLEIPSGALADIVGRKKTILTGQFFVLISVILLAFINSSTDVWISNFVCMIGMVCRSGADSALLYDSLKEIGREIDYQEIQGNALGNKLLAYAFCSLVVGFLSEIDLRLPFFLAIPWVATSCFLIFCFKEPVYTQKFSFKKQADLMKTSIRFVLNSRPVKWIIIFVVLISVSSQIWFYSYNLYFELVNLGLRYYGIIFFLLNIIACFFSRNAYKIEKKFNEQLCIVSMILLIGIPVLLMGLIVIKEIVILVLLQNVVRGFMEPFWGGFLNKHIDTENRATVISIKSAFGGFVAIVSYSLFGFILEIWTLTFCLQALGITVLFFGVIMVVWYRKIFKP